MVGLGNLDNTTDLLKPVSTATKKALDDKAPIANPTFTGTSFTTSGLLTCGNISTGPTSLSIITPYDDQVVVFNNWGDATCLGDLTVNGLLFGDALDFKLQPYALAADYSTTSSIASTYQAKLSVIKTSLSPLTLDSLTNALTIDLSSYSTTTGISSTYQKIFTATLPLTFNATTRILSIDLTSYQKSLAVTKTTASPLSLDGLTNALTIDLSSYYTTTTANNQFATKSDMTNVQMVVTGPTVTGGYHYLNTGAAGLTVQNGATTVAGLR